MGLFKGISEAKASVAANYLRQGLYLLRVDACKTGETRKKKEFACLEMKVVKVLHDPDQYPEKKQHRVGESVTHMLMAEHDAFLGNIKALVAAVLDIGDEEVTESECNDVFGPDQPLAGCVVEVEAIEIETKAGNPFTKVIYRRMLDDEEIAETFTEEEIRQFLPAVAE